MLTVATCVEFDLATSLFLRFLFVGVLNTGFSYSLYVLLVWLGIHFAPANLLATLAGIAFSFRTQGALVFGRSDWRLLRRFVPVWIAIYAINISIIALLIHFGLTAYIAGAVAILPTVLLSFLLQKRYVFAVASGETSLGSR